MGDEQSPAVTNRQGRPISNNQDSGRLVVGLDVHSLDVQRLTADP